MASDFRGFCRGFSVLLWLNLKHYALAIWGFRLRLDPDYPGESRFRGDLIVDAVLEYRGYGLFVPWCIFLAGLVPNYVCLALIVCWAFMTAERARYYKTALAFYTRAYQESPGKMRNKTRYAEELIREIERKSKAGLAWESPEMQVLIAEGFRIQNLIVYGGDKH